MQNRTKWHDKTNENKWCETDLCTKSVHVIHFSGLCGPWEHVNLEGATEEEREREGEGEEEREGKEEREGEGEGTTPKIKTKRLKYPVLFILEHGESLQNCVSKR